MQTRQIAEFVCNTTYEDLPPTVINQAKSCLLDTLAAVYAGAGLQAIQILYKTLQDAGYPQGSSTVIGFGKKVPLLSAGLLNSAMAQSQELDDFGKTAILHVGSTATPPALAAAEAFGKSGKDLLAAIVVGYEVGIRVGESVNPTHHKIWHTTGTCGTFAAVAAVAKLLNLDEEAVLHALGTAGTQASGLNQYMIDGGEMSKPLHAGKAAMNGCLAALLAQRGFTGATRIFEGEKGFCLATSEKPDLSKLAENLPPIKSEFKIQSVTQRLYPVNGHILSVLTGLFQLLEQRPDLQPETIDRVDVGLYSEAHNFLTPVKASTTFLARFSVPFCVSLAVNERHISTKLFSEKNLKRPDLLSFMDKVQLYEDPELTKTFPQKWSSVVRITTTQNEKIEMFTDAAKGDPSNPLTFDDIFNKLGETSMDFLRPEEVRRLADRIMNLETVENVSSLL